MLDHKTYVESFKNTITFRGKTISDLTKEVDIVLKDFYTNFPKESIKHLTIEQYALGLPSSKESYSYWLEFKTRDNVGSISGGSAEKFGIYYSKKNDSTEIVSKYKKESVESSMSYLTYLLDELLNFAENNNFNDIDNSIVSPNLKFKTLFMYYPDKFIPIYSEDHYDYLLRKLGLYNKSIKGIAKKQRQLINYKLSIKELKNMSNYEFAHYLYYLFGVPSYIKGEIKINSPGILADKTIQNKPRVVKIRNVLISPLNIKSHNNQNIIKKDYEKETHVNIKTGFSGEQLVMDYEVIRLRQSDYATKIQHVSLVDDSKGYDILSFEEDGSKRYIEVKSTKSQNMSKGKFYISENERKCAEGKNYWIYYVTGIDTDNITLNLINNPFENDKLILVPVNYKASFKIEENQENLK